MGPESRVNHDSRMMIGGPAIDGAVACRGAGDDPERLHFVQEKKQTLIWNRPPSMVTGLIFVSVFTATLPLVLLFSSSLTGPVLVALLLGFIILVGHLSLRSIIRHDRQSSPCDLPVPRASSTDELSSARLIAQGGSVLLSQLGDLTNQQFEPVIVHVRFPRNPDRTFILVFISFVVLAVGLSPPKYWVSAIWIGMGCTLIGMVIWTRILPRYYRVVPGRIDVMMASLFGRSLRVEQRIDLRTAKLRLRGQRQILEIESTDGRKDSIPFNGTSEPLAFVTAVFRGALCTSAAPPLPDDALLG